MQLSAMLFGVIYFAVAQQPATAAGTVKLENCHIYVVNRKPIEVPAQEAGVIKEMFVKEGQPIKPGESLVQIEDDIPAQQLKIAEEKLRAAEEQANNTIPKEYAEKSLEVARMDYQSALEANKKVKDTFPLVKLKEMFLKVQEMELSIQKAEMDTRIAKKQVNVQQAEMNLAQTTLSHRLLRSPLEGDGEVSEIKRHLGEWVQAGETVMRVVQMDVMWAEGSLNVSEYMPNEIIGKPVTVKVELDRGRTMTFPGKIVFVDPMIRPNGTYIVRAEVQNRLENDHWILRHGRLAQMTIQLK
jgi:multidrug efflux pump subunit AcrA (membrane-fusion protein)